MLVAIKATVNTTLKKKGTVLTGLRDARVQPIATTMLNAVKRKGKLKQKQ